MKTLIRVASAIVLTLGFCGVVSASGNQPSQQSMVVPAADCCIPPNCPPCDFPSVRK